MAALLKFFMDQGVDELTSRVIGNSVTGYSSYFNSTNAGGYMDPDYIQGYRFNPADKRWYSTPPSPAYGNYSWLNPASSSMQATLSQIQGWRNQKRLKGSSAK
jgi:hypothetical protein